MCEQGIIQTGQGLVDSERIMRGRKVTVTIWNQKEASDTWIWDSGVSERDPSASTASP